MTTDANGVALLMEGDRAHDDLPRHHSNDQLSSDALLHQLSDEDLLRRTGELTRRFQRTEAALLAHLSEIDVRRLYLREACSSLFAYCTERLHFSEGEAYHRIAAARAAREHPVVLEMLADGRLHPTAVALLAPHLTAANRDACCCRPSSLVSSPILARRRRLPHMRPSSRHVAVRPSSRYIPAAVRRAVYARDGGQCTYRDARGRRCSAREHLHFHHRIPYAHGGDHSVDNVALLCRAHNRFLAEIDYGTAATSGVRPAVGSCRGRAASCPSSADTEPGWRPEFAGP